MKYLIIILIILCFSCKKEITHDYVCIEKTIKSGNDYKKDSSFSILTRYGATPDYIRRLEISKTGTSHQFQGIMILKVDSVMNCMVVR